MMLGIVAISNDSTAGKVIINGSGDRVNPAFVRVAVDASRIRVL